MPADASQMVRSDSDSGDSDAAGVVRISGVSASVGVEHSEELALRPAPANEKNSTILHPIGWYKNHHIVFE